MKELSIKEKAKRYDEAIKRAKGAHNSAKSDKENGVTDKITEYTIQLTETIFPELKESEDERIRKSLIELFHDTVSNDEIFCDYGLDKTEVLAWLEKQGEQKPVEWCSEDEQNLNVCLSYIPHEFLRRWLKDIIHIKYDKPIDRVKPKFKVSDWEEYVNMWLDKMRKCQSEDTECGHVHADDILCELVKKYCPSGNEIVEIFEKIDKWYA